MWQIRHSHPEIIYIPRLIDPNKAARLGQKILELPVAPGQVDGQISRELIRAQVAKGQTPQQAIRERLEGDKLDREMCGLMVEIGLAAMQNMSGLRRGGLPPLFSPWSVTYDTNIYKPGETLPTHIDDGMKSDIVAATLLGNGADFMHVNSSAAIYTMPDETQILQHWKRIPGDAVALRNHSTSVARDGPGLPPHAVQNGDQRRVSLQIEVSYHANGIPA